jgi:peptidylprolyl isomerase
MTTTRRIAAVLILLASFERTGAADVVARMGDVEATADELRGFLESLSEPERAALAKDPALRSQAVRTYLARRALVREAASKKWDQSKPVKAKLERVREQALAELYLDSVSQPPDGYPSEAEVAAAYDANRAALTVPRQYRVAQIFVAAGGNVEEGRRKAEELARRAREKGADFAALARAESDEKDAARTGGEIGWLTEDQMVPGIRATVTSLGKEQISDAVRLDDGWHVLMLQDVKPPSVRPLAEVREALATRLRADRVLAVRRDYVAKLLEANPPAVNELALSKLIAGSK